MKCVVPGANVKILGKAIHALAKIGDEMYVQPQENGISFRTVNMANSAYADFSFYENYFSYYKFEDLEEDDALKCKISMRSAMTVFKTPNLIDKQVETCHIILQPNASHIKFLLKYKNSITKTHILPILESEKLQAKYNKDSACNQLSSQPRVLGDAVQNFNQNLIEITLDVSPQKILLRNYVDDVSGMANITRTQLALGIGEFDRFVVGTETTITFCMKELRAILSFAETVGVPISIYFETAGRPVVFVLKNSTYEANIVLSTLNPDVDSQTETTLIGKQEQMSKRRTTKNRSTRKSNKTSSRIENWSIKSRTTKASATENVHPFFIEEEKEQRLDISVKQSVDAQSDSLFSTPNSDVLRKSAGIENNREERHMQENQEKVLESTPSSTSISSRLSKSSLSGKKLASTVFSTITKRKSNNLDTSERNGDKDQMDLAEDAIPSSPPPPMKKARMIFQKCFQKTFDPRMLPGHDIILAEDSDENCSE